MTETTTKTTEQSREPFLGSAFWFSLLFTISSLIFRRFLPFFAAAMLAGVVATGIGYFTLSKPRVGFLRFFLYAQACIAVALSAIWLIPQWLRAVMPEFWAYAIPLLLLFNAIYFLPPLNGSGESRRGAWWKWILGSFLFAGLFAWLISSSA